MNQQDKIERTLSIARKLQICIEYVAFNYAQLQSPRRENVIVSNSFRCTFIHCAIFTAFSPSIVLYGATSNDFRCVTTISSFLYLYLCRQDTKTIFKSSNSAHFICTQSVFLVIFFCLFHCRCHFCVVSAICEPPRAYCVTVGSVSLTMNNLHSDAFLQFAVEMKPICTVMRSKTHCNSCLLWIFINFHSFTRPNVSETKEKRRNLVAALNL